MDITDVDTNVESEENEKKEDQLLRYLRIKRKISVTEILFDMLIHSKKVLRLKLLLNSKMSSLLLLL